MEVIEDNVTYEYKASDGKVVTLRRMSDRQRTRFFNFRVQEINRAFTSFNKELSAYTDPGTPGGMDDEPLLEMYSKFHAVVGKVVADLGDEVSDLETYRSWSDVGDWPDVIGISNAIVGVEMPQEESTMPVPHPDKIDDLSEKEIERLGESLDVKATAGRTKRSRPVAETSSSGAGSTAAEKPETSVTSPETSLKTGSET